jgi:hypothetical protein
VSSELDGRNRRISPVAAHSGDRLLSEPTAGTQPCRREPLFMPRCRRSGRDWDRPSRVANCPSPRRARDDERAPFSGHLIAMSEPVSRCLPAVIRHPTRAERRRQYLAPADRSGAKGASRGWVAHRPGCPRPASDRGWSVSRGSSCPRVGRRARDADPLC